MESNSDSQAVHLICGCQFQDGQLFSSSNLNIFGLGLIKITESDFEDLRLKSNSVSYICVYLFLFSKKRANVDNVYLWLSNQRKRCCRCGIFCIRLSLQWAMSTTNQVPIRFLWKEQTFLLFSVFFKIANGICLNGKMYLFNLQTAFV